MKAVHLLPVLTWSVALAAGSVAIAGPYPPAAGIAGTTAISADDPAIKGWATGYDSNTFKRGLVFVAEEDLGRVSHGEPEDALGKADVKIRDFQTFNVVSLGDGGTITLTFELPITNGPGFDFAVFENGFEDVFLELAFVEVSSDGLYFQRFPSFSLTPTNNIVETLNPDAVVDDFYLLDPTNLHNLAGKYRGEYGTPFDLSELPEDPRVNTRSITHVRIVDVIGSITPGVGSVDSEGRLIKDPFPTRFETGGFDLDAVAVLNQVPEPAAAVSMLLGAALLGLSRRRG